MSQSTNTVSQLARPRALAVLSLVASLATAAFLVVGCSDSPTGVEGQGSVALSVAMSGSSAKAGGVQIQAPGATITLTRARFLLREIRLKSVVEDSLSFRSSPLIADLDLQGGVTQVGVASVPAGLYDEVKFKVHRLDPDDSKDVPFLNQPEFADFNVADRPSIVIEGTIDDGSGPVAFTFLSQDDEELELALVPPMEVVAGQGAHLTLAIDPSNWFSDGAGGVLDPRDVASQQLISDNVEASIEGFEDDDRDGQRD